MNGGGDGGSVGAENKEGRDKGEEIEKEPRGRRITRLESVKSEVGEV